jgi:allantoinase
VKPEKLHHRHKLTPYAGRTLHGVVRRTLLRGETVYENGDLVGQPAGRILTRGGR